ncbi:S8 family serine peptidase [Streptomyces sp. DSM 42041]|uniref:S8 family serine peptidase n=1 Tax=Streptomyces hazeniae TaxID=3075538 RepID=A0ABU2NRG5_9ACTN|nr:S8 family serine peptidase [Streptomyces sp. DSM 42041]MDT0379569.1 S8 family serine peptidase [Streptomyces sp. DSM 42041]
MAQQQGSPQGNSHRRTAGKRRKVAVAVSAAVATAAVGTALALPATAAPPQGTVIGAQSDKAVAGSYIVTMNKSALSASSESGKDVVEEHGGTVKDTFTRVLDGYAVAMSGQEARELAADPAVDEVYANKKFTITGEQSNPPNWGLDRVDQTDLPLDDTYTYPDGGGEGVTAYVIDTGVRVSHQDFGGRAVDGYDAVEDDDVAQDGNGHGTHVASTIAGEAHGVAKKAKIVGVRVLDDQGSGTTAQVVAGIDWVAQNASGPSVANMSLGGPEDPVLDEAVQKAIDAGISFAVAAGNDSSDAGSSSPARVPDAITVGATDDTDAQASFSNYGSVLDIYAPGVDITAAWNTGDDATNTISGTSMATPHVAGVAALYLETNTGATPADVSTALTDAAVPDVVGNPGSGSPNLLLNVVK